MNAIRTGTRGGVCGDKWASLAGDLRELRSDCRLNPAAMSTKWGDFAGMAAPGTGDRRSARMHGSGSASEISWRSETIASFKTRYLRRSAEPGGQRGTKNADAIRVFMMGEERSSGNTGTTNEKYRDGANTLSRIAASNAGWTGQGDRKKPSRTSDSLGNHGS